MEKGFAPLIEGADPTRMTKIIRDIQDVACWYGGGIAALALSGVEIALQDLKGKMLNMPAYLFLGGKLRDHVKACASMIFDMENLENTVALAERFKGRINARSNLGGVGHRTDISVEKLLAT